MLDEKGCSILSGQGGNCATANGPNVSHVLTMTGVHSDFLVHKGTMEEVNCLLVPRSLGGLHSTEPESERLERIVTKKSPFLRSSNPHHSSGCYTVYYCSAYCQKAAWSGHRAVCNQTKEQIVPATLKKFEGFLRNNDSTSSWVEEAGPAPSQGHHVVKIVIGAQFKNGLTVYNKDRSILATLEREEGQEELYDELKADIEEHGVGSYKAFYSLILVRDDGEEEGFKVKINPLLLIPLPLFRLFQGGITRVKGRI